MGNFLLCRDVCGRRTKRGTGLFCFYKTLLRKAKPQLQQRRRAAWCHLCPRNSIWWGTSRSPNQLTTRRPSLESPSVTRLVLYQGRWKSSNHRIV